MKKFPWGRVIEDFVVGPYRIRAFHPNKSVGATVTCEIDFDKVHYHGYIDDEDTNEAWLTLDEAMVGLVARRALGRGNTQIGQHFVAGLNSMKENQA